MGKEVYLFAANVLVWVGLGCYVAFLATSQQRLKRRLSRLEILHDDN